MIVKIWPIKAAYAPKSGKVGGIQGLRNSIDYVSDENKCIPREKDLNIAYLDKDGVFENSYINKDEDVSRVVTYMSNEEKVKSKYITAYMCNEDTVIEDFLDVQRKMLNRTNTKRNTGNIAFHLVQSFPEELNITDEEVHQCGIELVKKLDKFQAYICSHVHPEVNEEGEVHGRCKHNHILINAFIHPEKLDPDNPNNIKYYDNKDTYRQLQMWNDEIAIDHGLPIVRNPEMEQSYNWKESEEINKGLSWKQQVRNDIENIKQKTSNWADFVKEMNRLGYHIRDGKHTTFTAPDGIHRVRGNVLGSRFLKENIIKYWALRDDIKEELLYRKYDDKQYSLKDIKENAKSPLYVDVILGGNLNPKKTVYPLPLDKVIMNQQAIDSYFDLEKYYEIKNEDGDVVDSVQGLELNNYFTSILKNEKERIKQKTWWESEQEKRRWQNVMLQEHAAQQYYSNNKFKNSKTKQTYKISLYTKDGRLKSELELIFTLAYMVIHAEQGNWEMKTVPQEHVRDAYFGPPAWKAQNMMDSIQIAREEGIDNQYDIEAKLHTTGAALSRARAAVKRNEKIKNSMETLKQAIDEYEAVKYQAERIFYLPDSDEKFRLINDNKDIIDRYNRAKRILHMNKVESAADIFDFKKRYGQVQKNVDDSQQLLDEKKDEYRRLKKLQYNTSLAQDVRYCYGPEYSFERDNNIDRDQSQSDNRNVE